MNICVFDTETAGSFNKPFCYNIGYVIADTETKEILVRKDFVVEQVWHNLPLFTSAYYADKREGYVKAMKGRKTVLKKFGYITREMARDFEIYGVKNAYAFNSAFDENVFNFNCDWYKCINPFDTIQVFDIRAFAIQFLVNDEYKDFCDKFSLYTDSGNYSTTAETMFKFITNDETFVENHTALSDSEIEFEILMACSQDTEILTTVYSVPKSIERISTNTLTIKKNKEIIFETDYHSLTFYKSKNTIVLK